MTARFKTEQRLRVGVIGCGYWGPNLIRNFHALKECELAAISDRQSEKLQSFQLRFPQLKTYKEASDLIRDPAIDAVAIATPISTHHSIAKQALMAGKHVLIEKPLAASVREVDDLIRLSRKVNKVLMVGHTFEYHPAVLKIEDLIRKKSLGPLYYIDAIRGNLGLYQSDGRNVIWDLAPHDLSIILRWVGRMPQSVSAWGQSFVHRGIEDVAFIRLEFGGGVLAHLHISWLAPSKIRKMTIVGAKKMVIYDDLENVEKIKIADQGAHLDTASTKVRIAYRLGDIMSPRIDVDEPLARQCSHFVQCSIHNKKPETDGECGRRVVRILEVADKSIKRGGKIFSL